MAVGFRSLLGFPLGAGRTAVAPATVGFASFFGFPLGGGYDSGAPATPSGDLTVSGAGVVSLYHPSTSISYEYNTQRRTN